jgi:hypothetical protein
MVLIFNNSVAPLTGFFLLVVIKSGFVIIRNGGYTCFFKTNFKFKQSEPIFKTKNAKNVAKEKLGSTSQPSVVHRHQA